MFEGSNLHEFTGNAGERPCRLAEMGLNLKK